MAWDQLKGMDRNTGGWLAGADYVRQCVEEVLTTPKGTRVMRRDLGFEALEPDGSSKTGLTRHDVQTQVHDVLREELPILAVERVDPELDEKGRLRRVTVAYTEHDGHQRDEVRVTFA